MQFSLWFLEMVICLPFHWRELTQDCAAQIGAWLVSLESGNELALVFEKCPRDP